MITKAFKEFILSETRLSFMYNKNISFLRTYDIASFNFFDFFRLEQSTNTLKSNSFK